MRYEPPPITVAEDAPASEQDVRHHAASLKRIGSKYGLTRLRVDADGTLIGRLSRPGYHSVLLFQAAVHSDLGIRIHAITDDGEIERKEVREL